MIEWKQEKESRTRLEKLFIQLLQKKEIKDISITELCKLAHLNRSTFYANYLDIYDLADQLRDKLEQEVTNLYHEEHIKGYNSNDYLKLFYHIKENQLFYKTYFKLGYDHQFKITKYDRNQAQNDFQGEFIDYHIVFFKSGLTAIIEKWLASDCFESPEQMNQILQSEYQNRKKD